MEMITRTVKQLFKLHMQSGKSIMFHIVFFFVILLTIHDIILLVLQNFQIKQLEVFCFNPMITQCSGHFCLIGKCLMICYIKSEILLTFAFVLFLLTANLRTLSVAVSHFLNCYLVSDRIL